MPFPLFDISRIKTLPLNERVHDIDISVNIPLDEPIIVIEDKKYDQLSDAILTARNNKASVILMYGAHVIRKGNSLHMIELMRRGLITHFATNGAGAIHDFELAMIGSTCESVARYISEGQFGLWTETGRLNDAVRLGDKDGLGFGEAVGKYIWENNFKYREQSVLAMAYHYQVPCTVHVGIGNDIIHELPNFDAAATGRASYKDFLIFAKNVEKLQGGVFLNAGSAVTGPEVYLKALAMARNVAKQEGKSINLITTAVFDMQPLGDNVSETPQKTDPRYYFRPWKTILSRTVADGGKSMYFCGDHADTVPNLARRLIALDNLNN